MHNCDYFLRVRYFCTGYAVVAQMPHGEDEIEKGFVVHLLAARIVAVGRICSGKGIFLCDILHHRFFCFGVVPESAWQKVSFFVENLWCSFSVAQNFCNAYLVLFENSLYNFVWQGLAGGWDTDGAVVVEVQAVWKGKNDRSLYYFSRYNSQK